MKIFLFLVLWCGQIFAMDFSIDWLAQDIAERYNQNTLSLQETTPILLASVTAHSSIDRQNTQNTLLRDLRRRLPTSCHVRICDRCQQTSIQSNNEKTSWAFAALTPRELKEEDQKIRGTSRAANSALFVHHGPQGISYRLQSLQDHRILAAGSLSPKPSDQMTQKRFQIRQNQVLKARGESLVYSKINTIAYPSAHISFELLEQWGDYNQYLTGLFFSLYNPAAGFGFVHYQAFPEYKNALLGVNWVISIPTLLQSEEGFLGSLRSQNIQLLSYIPISDIRHFGITTFIGINGTTGFGGIGIGLAMFL